MPSNETKSASSYRDRNSTADRTLDILNMFDDERPRITAAELTKEFGVARSTAYRYLQTLSASRFIEEDPRGGYRLGLRVFELARTARRAYGFSETVGPVLAELSESTGETALLTRRHGAQVVCLEMREAGGRHLRISYERGSVLAPNAGASALVLFAWEDAEELMTLLGTVTLPRFTPRTLTDPADLLRRLGSIREQGFAVSHGELDLDAIGVAAPVRDEEGAVAAAVSVVAVSSRVTGATVEHLVGQVLHAARRLTDALDRVGY
jgi:DNA-binding IclR family transcriptional regulator